MSLSLLILYIVLRNGIRENEARSGVPSVNMGKQIGHLILASPLFFSVKSS